MSVAFCMWHVFLPRFRLVSPVPTGRLPARRAYSWERGGIQPGGGLALPAATCFKKSYFLCTEQAQVSAGVPVPTNMVTEGPPGHIWSEPAAKPGKLHDSQVLKLI